MVAVCGPRSAGLIVALLAVVQSGAAYLPLDPDTPADRLAFMVADAGAQTVLLHRDLTERFPALAAAALLIDDHGLIDGRGQAGGRGPEGEPASGAGPGQAGAGRYDAPDDRLAGGQTRPGRAARADDLAYVIYTSGSTGKPKGVEVSQRNVVALLAAGQRLFGFDERDTWTMFHSAAFDFSVWEMWGALAFGGRLVVVPFETSRDPAQFAELMRRHEVTVLNQTPSAFGPLARRLAEAGDAGALRLVIFGGEALDVTELRPWFDRFGADRPELVNMYGITEATVHVTCHRLSPRSCAREPRAIGAPIPGAYVHVVDAHGNLLPDGVTGEMYLGGSGVARGYRNRPELTAQRFVADPCGGAGSLYRSGDLACYRPDGTLEFHGRADDQVQVRGFRVEIGEIESVLAEHPAVQEAAVVQRRDGNLAAYVVPSRQRARPVRRLIEAGGDRPLIDLPGGAAVYAANASETEFMGREIFADRVYLQDGITLPDHACVFDVGANIGLFAIFAAQACRDPRVFAFEPLPPLLDLLRRNLHAHDIRAEILPCGAGAAAGTAPFSYYPYATVLSGRYADAAQERAVVKSFLTGQLDAQGVRIDDDVIDELLIERLRTEPHECAIRPVSDVISEYGVEHIDLLKIDVEKSELDVLAGITGAHFPRIDQVIVEVHDRSGRLAQVRDLLHGHGYRTTVRRDPQLADTELYNVYATRLAQGATAGQPARIWRGPSALLADLRGFAAATLPYYMIPVAWTLLPDLPVTANGKRDRAALPDPDGGAAPAEYVAPATDTERVIAGIWAELLGRGRVGGTDNFFAIGGHSLLATRVISRIRQELGVALPLAAVFAQPTVTALAREADQLRPRPPRGDKARHT